MLFFMLIINPQLIRFCHITTVSVLYKTKLNKLDYEFDKAKLNKLNYELICSVCSAFHFGNFIYSLGKISLICFPFIFVA